MFRENRLEHIAGYVDAALTAILDGGGYESPATFDGDFSKRLRRFGMNSSLQAE